MLATLSTPPTKCVEPMLILVPLPMLTARKQFRPPLKLSTLTIRCQSYMVLRLRNSQ